VIAKTNLPKRRQYWAFRAIRAAAVLMISRQRCHGRQRACLSSKDQGDTLHPALFNAVKFTHSLAAMW